MSIIGRYAQEQKQMLRIAHDGDYFETFFTQKSGIAVPRRGHWLAAALGFAPIAGIAVWFTVLLLSSILIEAIGIEATARMQGYRHYELQAADGRTYSGARNTTNRGRPRFGVGETVTVRYLKFAPSISHVGFGPPERTMQRLSMNALIWLAFIVIAPLAIFSSEISLRSMARALRPPPSPD